MNEVSEIRTLPLLPMKNSVLYPGLLLPLAVGRPGSVAAVEASLGSESKEIVIVAQKDGSEDSPGAGGLYTVGTRATIRKSQRHRPDHIDIMVLGIERVVVVKVEENGYLKARVSPLPLPFDSTRETEALALNLQESAAKYV